MSSVTVVSEEDVDPVDLPGGSWSRVMVSDANIEDPAMTMGRSMFRAGTLTDSMRHESEEVAFVIAGAGYLMLEDARVDLVEGEACHIPPGLWHAVGADETDMEMVFGFASPAYPATEFRKNR